MSQLNLKIGPKIKGFRRQLGIQANKLAEKLNISPSYLTLIEGGRKLKKGIINILNKFNNNKHIFNLSHGVLPHTPVENVKILVDTIRNYNET